MKKNEVMGIKYNNTIVVRNEEFKNSALELNKTIQVSPSHSTFLKHDYFMQKLFDFIKRYN